MASRDGWPKRDIDNYYVGKTGLDEMDTRTTGYPVGYPLRHVYQWGFLRHQGRWLSARRKENYNIPKNKPEQIMIVMGDGSPSPPCTITPRVTDSDTIEIKAPKTLSEETLGYLLSD